MAVQFGIGDVSVFECLKHHIFAAFVELAVLPAGVVAQVVREPPPHAGIPEEESLTAGPGSDGGVEVLDGPTFAASEGWDWIPKIAAA